MITNRRKAAQTGKDFYPTPEWATHALMQSENFKGTILEPACGNGAMSEVILSYGHKVISADLLNYGYDKAKTRDFLCTNVPRSNIITNPPYNLAEKFLDHSLKLADRKIALLLRLAFLEGVKRNQNVFFKNPPSTVWVFSERITFYPKGIVTAGSGTTAYGWFVWDKQDSSTVTNLKWLPVGLKQRYKL